MTPPELAADTPVLDVLQPVAIGVLVLLRIELDIIVHYWRKGDVGKVLHLEEPLCRELWLDRHIGTLREAHLIIIVLNLLHQTGVLKVDGNLLAHVHAVHTYIETCCLADGTIVVEDIDGFQTVLQTEGVVVDIVSWSYLQATSTELDIYVCILDDRNLAVYDRHDNVLTLQPGILLILWVDTHGRVAHDGLRTGGCYYCIVSLLILVHHVLLIHLLAVLFYYIILQVVELRVLVLVDNLLVRECSLSLRVPVNHAHATIDESLLVKVAEYVDDGTRAGLVHGECCAVPIAAGTEFAELFEDDATMLVSPVPSVLEELLAGKVGLLDALLSEAVYNLCLGSDTGMVGTWYPTCVLALHASTANENILDSIVEHVSHVEHTCYVWWRDNHCIRFTTIWLRAEKLVVEPVLIPFTFHCLWIVFTC